MKEEPSPHRNKNLLRYCKSNTFDCYLILIKLTLTLSKDSWLDPGIINNLDPDIINNNINHHITKLKVRTVNQFLSKCNIEIHIPSIYQNVRQTHGTPVSLK